VWVLRLNIAIVTIIPLTFAAAGNIWMLIPAFLAQGLVQGGFELGAATSAIALAERGRVMEYTAIQSVAIGLRGMVAPLIGAALLGMGLTETTILVIAAALVAISWGMMRGVPDKPGA
jgi:hypothetical protein